MKKENCGLWTGRCTWWMKHHVHQKKGYTWSSAYKTLAWFWIVIYQKASDRGCATSICNGPTNHLHLHDFQHQHWLASCRWERSSSSKSSSLTALNHVQHFSKSITFIVSLGPQPSLHGSTNVSLPIHIQADGRRKQFVNMVCPQLQLRMLTKVQGLQSSFELN
jgi:hypothetical protein